MGLGFRVLGLLFLEDFFKGFLGVWSLGVRVFGDGGFGVLGLG